jgi:hypothetical protein
MSSIVGDIVDSIVAGVVSEWKRKTGKRRRRRKRTLTPTERLRRIETLLKPARKKTSRRKSARSRSSTQRRRVRARTQKHRRSLRRG